MGCLCVHNFDLISSLEESGLPAVVEYEEEAWYPSNVGMQDRFNFKGSFETSEMEKERGNLNRKARFLGKLIELIKNRELKKSTSSDHYLSTTRHTKLVKPTKLAINAETKFLDQCQMISKWQDVEKKRDKDKHFDKDDGGKTMKGFLFPNAIITPPGKVRRLNLTFPKCQDKLKTTKKKKRRKSTIGRLTSLDLKTSHRITASTFGSTKIKSETTEELKTNFIRTNKIIEETTKSSVLSTNSIFEETSKSNYLRTNKNFEETTKSNYLRTIQEPKETSKNEQKSSRKSNEEITKASDINPTKKYADQLITGQKKIFYISAMNHEIPPEQLNGITHHNNFKVYHMQNSQRSNKTQLYHGDINDYFVNGEAPEKLVLRIPSSYDKLPLLIYKDPDTSKISFSIVKGIIPIVKSSTSTELPKSSLNLIKKFNSKNIYHFFPYLNSNLPVIPIYDPYKQIQQNRLIQPPQDKKIFGNLAFNAYQSYPYMPPYYAGNISLPAYNYWRKGDLPSKYGGLDFEYVPFHVPIPSAQFYYFLRKIRSYQEHPHVSKKVPLKTITATAPEKETDNDDEEYEEDEDKGQRKITCLTTFRCPTLPTKIKTTQKCVKLPDFRTTPRPTKPTTCKTIKYDGHSSLDALLSAMLTKCKNPNYLFPRLTEIPICIDESMTISVPELEANENSGTDNSMNQFMTSNLDTLTEPLKGSTTTKLNVTEIKNQESTMKTAFSSKKSTMLTTETLNKEATLLPSLQSTSYTTGILQKEMTDMPSGKSTSPTTKALNISENANPTKKHKKLVGKNWLDFIVKCPIPQNKTNKKISTKSNRNSYKRFSHSKKHKNRKRNKFNKIKQSNEQNLPSYERNPIFIIENLA